MPVSTALPTITPTYSNSSGAASASLVLDFSKIIAAGTGLITISDGATQTYMGKDGTLRTRLIGATDTRTIDITDTSKVTISGKTVTISLDSNLSPGKSYSVQMAAGVLQDQDGNAYAALSDTSKLPFTTSAASAPSAAVDSGITLSADTGASAGDFITKSAAQTISGKYSGTLAAGDSIKVSLDNGGHWADAVVNTADNTWSYDGTLTGSSTVVARVTNTDGGYSHAVRQAYTFDAAPPAVASITMADSDLVAGETTTVTIAFNEAVTGLEIADFTVAGGELSNLAMSVDGKTWTAKLTPTMGVANSTGQITLKAGSGVDVAGNLGPANDSSQSFSYSTVPDAPTATVATVSMTDSGSSASDFITNATAQTVSGTYTGTLAGSEYVEVSLDNGVTWTKATTSGSAWSIPATTISASNTLKARVTNGYTYSNPVSKEYTLDQAAPTATVTLADSTLAIGETSLVTIKFGEAVTGFTNDDISVANGTLSTVASTDGGITWTATFTPSASTTDATNAVTVNKAGVTDIAGNAGSGSATSANYSVDTVRPTAAIAVADTALTAGETTTVTFTFSEAVIGFTAADVTVGNGTLSSLSSADGGTTWTATLTPLASVHDKTNVITLDNTAITDLAGNAGTGDTSSASYSVSTKRPTATIAIADTTLAAGESTTVTITFSEAVTGLSTAALSVSHGELSSLTSSDGGITWTGTLTPSASTHAITNVITLSNSVVKNASGNAGNGTTTSDNYTVATVRPTATITVADTALKVGDTSAVTITFSAAVTGLTAADFSVEHGSLSTPVTSDNGITWTATLTPSTGIEDTTNTITLDNTGVINASGNSGSGSTSSANYTVDTERPTAAITVADSALTAGETTTVTFTFSEAVTDFSTADLTVANGTLSSLSSSDGGTTWTATLTPSGSVDDSTNVITLDNTAITDAAGNAGTGVTSSANYTVATVRPTASIALSDTALKVNETATVTITFSEAVTGLTSADLTVANGTVSSLTSGDGGTTWTGTFTPSTNISDSTNIITLDNTGVQDASGNTGSGTTSSSNYTIDTLLPTATIALSDSALTVGETATVTITFSETVTGLTTADLTVANGALSSLSSADGGTTWAATFTPTASIEDTTNVITLDNTGVQNSAGNTGSGTTSSSNYTIDTLRPTASIALSDTSLAAGETATVTITFTEAVTGLSTADVTVANGTLSSLSSSDGGTTWTATLTPTGSLDDSTNVITLDNTGVTDSAGNAGTGATSSANYTVATVRPTATIALSDTALKVNETATVTITFSEAVTGLTSADLSVANGTVSSLASGDGGTTWTGTFTPSTSIEDTTNTITLDNTGVQDASGNTGSGATSSSNYTIDTVAPTATIALSDAVLITGETATVTITFSEAVTGLTTADFKSSGTLSGLASSNGGITWTATLTPSSNGSGEVQLYSSSVTDSAGNNGPDSSVSVNFTYNAAPTALVDSIDMSNDSGSSASDFITNLTSQDITGTLSAALASGEKVQVSLNGGDTWTDATTSGTSWTLSGQTISTSSTLMARVTNGVTTSTTHSQAYTLDQSAPSLSSISLSDSSLTGSETATVTLVFNEQVTGLATSDFSVSGGTLSGLSSTDNITWTGTLTPTASGSIGLSAASVTDLAGNSGPASASVSQEFSYRADATAPSATLSLDDSTLISGQTATLTLTLSEAVTDTPLASDFTVSGGSLGTFTSTDGGTTWTATLTPTASASGSGSVTLNALSISDPSGNAGPTLSTQLAFSYDTQAPGSLASKTPDLYTESDSYNSAAEGTSFDNITNDDTPTIGFSLASSGLTAGDYVDVLDTSNGNAILSTYTILSEALGAYGSTIYKTPSEALTEGTHTLVLRARDAAGNTGTQSSSLSITIDKTIASMSGKTLDLATASDSGTSSTDNITNDCTPTVTFNVANTSGLAAGDVLQVIDTSNGNTVVGSHTVVASDYAASAADISIDLSTLTDATHTLALRAVDKAGNTGTSSSTLSVTIDTTAPTLTSSSPSSSASSVDIDTSSITLTFSEALVTNSQTGFKISNSGNTQDVREIVFEALSGNTGTYNSTTHAVTLSLSGSLQYSDSYGVAVYNAALADTAGNSLSIGTSLMTFSTESATPSAVTLSLTESTYASHTGTDSDGYTSDNTLSVTGITESHLAYRLSSSNDWTTVAVSGSSYSITLPDGSYEAGSIQVKQYSSTDSVSSVAQLSSNWTVDTSATTLWINSSSSFYGLGTDTGTSITIGWDGEVDTDSDLIEYSTDGSTWTTASSLTWSAATLSNVKVAAGGEVQVRTVDKAGNAGLYSGSTYVAYFGDSTATTHTATGGKHLFLQGADDIVNISGNTNVIYASNGQNTLNITAGTSNSVVGGEDADTVNITGASTGSTAYTFAGNDIITIGSSATSSTIYAGDGNDTIAISNTSTTIDGGAGTDTIKFNASASLSSLVDKVTNIEKLYVTASNTLTIDGSSITKSDVAAMGFSTVTPLLTTYALVKVDGDSSAHVSLGTGFSYYSGATELIGALGQSVSGYYAYVDTSHQLIVLLGSNFITS